MSAVARMSRTTSETDEAVSRYRRNDGEDIGGQHIPLCSRDKPVVEIRVYSGSDDSSLPHLFAPPGVIELGPLVGAQALRVDPFTLSGMEDKVLDEVGGKEGCPLERSRSRR